MQKIFFVKTIIFIWLLLVFCAIHLKAQDSMMQHKNLLRGFIFKGNHIEFDLSTFSTFKANVKRKSGTHHVGATAALGLSLGLKYKINFNNYYSLLVGFESLIAGRNLITSFDKDNFSPPLVHDYKFGNKETYSADLMLSIPVLFEKRILFDNAKYLFVTGGFRLNFSTGADLEVISIFLMNTDNGFYNAGGWSVYANNNARPWPSFPISAGYSWLLKNNNLFQFGICSNISLTKYMNGSYMIIIPGQELTEGRYSSTGSYIGITFSYIFTNANSRLANPKIKG